MPTFVELLGPGDRDRLTALASQDAAPDLPGIARDAAAESQGDGKAAWLLVATALAAAATPEQARAALGQVLDDDPLRTLALACLAVLEDTYRSVLT